MNDNPVKYKIDKESGAIFYPCNYGFITHTLSGEGDPVYILDFQIILLQPGL